MKKSSLLTAGVSRGFSAGAGLSRGATAGNAWALREEAKTRREKSALKTTKRFVNRSNMKHFLRFEVGRVETHAIPGFERDDYISESRFDGFLFYLSSALR